MGCAAQIKVNIKSIPCNDSSLQGVINYCFIETPFGVEMFLASTSKGVVFLGFGEIALVEAREEYPKATFIAKKSGDVELIERYFKGESVAIDVALCGSDFKINVLKSLVTAAPLGKIITYSDLAESAGCKKAVRAAASAIAKNPVSLLIPCHRVVRKGGDIGQYRWRSEVKRILIDYETKIER